MSVPVSKPIEKFPLVFLLIHNTLGSSDESTVHSVVDETSNKMTFYDTTGKSFQVEPSHVVPVEGKKKNFYPYAKCTYVNCIGQELLQELTFDLQQSEPFTLRQSVNTSQFVNQQVHGQFNGVNQQASGQFNGVNQQAPGQFNGGNQQASGQFNGGNQQAPGQFNGVNQQAPGQFNGGNQQAPGQFNGGNQQVPGQFASGASQSHKGN